MSRSFHQSHSDKHGKSNKGSVDFIMESDKRYKVKNKHKDIQIIEQLPYKEKVKWKRKKHLAYGEQRNFRFHGKPIYAGESYAKKVGEYIGPVIEPRKERVKNKININNYEDFEN